MYKAANVKRTAYTAADTLNSIAGILQSKECDNEETGQLRAELYQILHKADIEIKAFGDKIY